MRSAKQTMTDVQPDSGQQNATLDRALVLTIAMGPKPRPMWQRLLSCFLMLILWLGPLEFVFHDAQRSATQLGVGSYRLAARDAYVEGQVFAERLRRDIAAAEKDGNWLTVLSELDQRLPGYFDAMATRYKVRLPSISFGTAAMAAPIVDPSAPIRFQPSITTSTGVGGGTPVVNITAPNAAGISLNQYSQFNVDVVGLILNNSLVTGGATLGGTVAANSALGGRTASQIINQVTTQGSASRIAGTIEVFGAPADVIIANPNGISCTACGFINTPRVVMTTGEPQFLSSRGGVASGFEAASALSYNVIGGHIQIEGLSGANGVPGAGIEGSAGVVDLIGSSIGVNASINAGKQINLISGQQTVAEAVASQGKIGSDYQVTPNGGSPSVSGAQPTVQIDATAFGAMNAGQIKVIATSAGLGVNIGALNANNGVATVEANGDVNIGKAYGSQGVGIRANGAVNVDNLTSYGEATVSAGADVGLAKITVANNASLSGRNVGIGDTVVGGNLTVSANANIVTSQTGAVVGNSTFIAGASFANTGNWTSGGELSLNATTVANASSSQLAGLNATKVTATDLRNYGTLYGGKLTLALAGALDNSFGSVLAKTALSASMNYLYSNLNGTIYVGDPNAPTTAAPYGDLTLSVRGNGSSINNLGGLIAASSGLTVDAANAAIDLSDALTGQINAGGALTINAGALVNSGSWLASGTTVSLSGTNGIANLGVMQTSGSLVLTSSTGPIINGGAIVAGQDLSASGNLVNTTGAILHAGRDVTLVGAGSNAGTVEALRDVTLQGSDFGNSSGVIQANNNVSVNMTGTLTNVAGIIAAQNDVSVRAASVTNDRSAPVTVVSTSEQVINLDLLKTAKTGTYGEKYLSASQSNGSAQFPTTYSYRTVDALISLILANALSVDAAAGTFTVAGEFGAITTYKLPTVDRIVLQQKEGTAGQILAGNNAIFNTDLLSNRGGVVAAGKNLIANLANLENGSSETIVTSRAGDAVNLASLVEFSQANRPYFAPLTDYVAASNLVAPSTVVETTVLGTRGILRAGTDVFLNGSGNLVNAGDLVAGNNISITLPGNFVNQGTYQSSFTTRPGCLPSATCREDNARVDSFAYQQTSNNVVAGGTLTVTAASISNDFGTLSARGNVNLSANSVDNLAGTILSTAGDVNISAASITNRVVSPVSTHISYGNENPEFAQGCNAGGTYKGSECNVDRQNQASAAAVISGARNVNMDGDSLVNTGGLITAGADANINISGSIANTAVALNTYWQGHWTEETCWICSDKEHYTSGVVADGTQVAAIQAGNTLTMISGGNVINTGNLYGTDVALSGINLTNGITDSRQPTAASTVAPQLIAIGVSGEVVSSGGTPSSAAPVYAVSASGGELLSSFGPSLLVSNLPAQLRPDTNLFYYDAASENNLIRQAAITQTGSGTFINGVAWSTTDNLSIDDQQKAVFYNNAIAYATQNNLQLGKPLTAEQVSALDKPMLWYTEQTVPDPACSFSSTACGTVNALTPQVYLPQGYAGSTSGGVISGTDVKLTFRDSITNTGIIEATALNVQTATLTNEQRSVDIGTSAYKVQGGWMEYSGTQLQPGGFMSAVNLNVQADRITAIGDAFRVVNADGTRDVAGTAALLSTLRQQLGADFTEITPHDNIRTNFIKDTSGPGALGQVIAIAIAIALSVITAGAGLAVVGAMTGTAVAAGSAAAIVAAGIQAAIVGTLSSIATQVITTGNLNLGTALQSGVTSGLISGITAGVLGNAPGSTNAATTVTPGVDGATQISKGLWSDFMANPSQYAINTAVRSGISSAINSAVYGGSFGTAFLSGVVADAAAIGANGIGGNTQTYSLQNVLSHALLGCAASTLAGSECAGGAIGGASSALVAPLIRDALYDGKETVNTVDNSDGTKTITTSYNNQTYNATITALALLTGGGMAALLGRDALAAANSAHNEALNNATSTKVTTVPTMPVPLPTPFGMIMTLPGWLTAPLPGTPNQSGIDEEYALTGMPNQSGKFTNWGTSLPAFIDDISGYIKGIPNQAGQWIDTIRINPNLCASSAVICASILMMSTGIGGSDGGGGNSGANTTTGTGNSVPALDWTRINPQGQNAVDHVNLHSVDDLTKPIQSIFNRDPILTTEEAWAKVKQTGIQPVVQANGNLAYDVPMGTSVGWQGGSKGSGAQLTTVRIITTPSGQVVTAFPK